MYLDFFNIHPGSWGTWRVQNFNNYKLIAIHGVLSVEFDVFYNIVSSTHTDFTHLDVVLSH